VSKGKGFQACIKNPMPGGGKKGVGRRRLFLESGENTQKHPAGGHTTFVLGKVNLTEIGGTFEGEGILPGSFSRARE